LGESAFVSDVLSQANEKYERKYELKRFGFDLNRLALKVSEIYDIDVDNFLSKGKQQKKVKARSLFCYWAVNELGGILDRIGTANWNQCSSDRVLCGAGKGDMQGKQFSVVRAFNLET